VAAIGEHRVGAGVGTQNMIAVFVGTGIGGGLILNGEVFAGSRGTAGEVGHIITIADGPYASGSGVRGGIEAIASRTAIERDLRHAIDKGRQSILPELLAERDGAMTSSVLAKAVAKKDELTLEVLSRAAFYLGLHAGSLINAFDPDMLVYGGGVIEGLGKWILPQIEAVAYQHCINRKNLHQVKIVEAKLGEEAGVVGAALMARP
jgi:glucokinase